MKEWLRAQPETAGALMSGSGSTMFALLRDPLSGPDLAIRARALFGPGLWLCQTMTA